MDKIHVICHEWLPSGTMVVSSDLWRAIKEQSAPKCKGPILQPCSACSEGDYRMEHHDHDYVAVEKRRDRRAGKRRQGERRLDIVTSAFIHRKGRELRRVASDRRTGKDRRAK